MMVLAAMLVFLIWAFVYWRHRVRLRKRRDTLSTTYEDRTSGQPRGPKRLNKQPGLSPPKVDVPYQWERDAVEWWRIKAGECEETTEG